MLVAAAGLLLLSAPPPAAAVLCHPMAAVDDPLGYAHCQFGCELGAVQRFLANPDPENLFIACPA